MGWFSLPPPDAKVDDWHVSPSIDIAAYAFSWLWILIPLAFLGPTRADYVGVYILILAATDVHRHYNFPYVYADSQVRAQYPLRFFLFPGLLLALFVASPWLASLKVFLSTSQVAAAAAWVVVLFQVLRRDGSEEAPDLRTLATAVIPLVAGATALSLWGPSIDGRLGAATWWFAGALLAATYLDFDLRRRRARAREHGPKSSQPGAGAPARRRRLFVAPALVLLLLAVATIWGPGIDAAQRHGGFRLRHVLNTVAVLAFLWNVWHVYAQKYGILRMYNAKAAALNGSRSPADKVAGWTDRMLVFAWVPLYFAWLGPAHQDTLRQYFPKARRVLPTAIDTLESIAWFTLPLCIGFLVVAVVVWIWHERKVFGLGSLPRLWMATGTFCLGAAFLLFDPVKAYLAFSFSHAVEYMVFVWAFQRRRYATPLPHQPLLQRILTRPWLAYLGFTVVLGASFVFLKYYGRFIFVDQPRPEFLGYRTSHWIGFWGIYQSMVHFYWDGFLWKMRLRTVRDTI